MIDAISIQLPEKTKHDVIEIKPKLANNDNVLASFIDSFMWRHPDSVNKSSLLQIEKHVLKKRYRMEQFFKMLLTVSADPRSPLNGEYLHKYLSELEMGDRDSVWSIFLHNNYQFEHSIVKRHIEWARNADKTHLSAESYYLEGLTLPWFLTSSNRMIRDKATKTLVSLLSDNIDILIRILKKFSRCNDPYVVERLFCASYGCAMNSNSKSELKNLADYIYLNVFKKSNPPPNILLRDYARSIIQYAIHKDIKLDVDCKKLNPPYHTKWIQHFPTKKEVKNLNVIQPKTPSHGIDYGVQEIFHSLGPMGDFYRYIIEHDLDNFDLSKPLLSKKQSRDTVFKEFIKSLTDVQKTSWEIYYRIATKTDTFSISKKNGGKIFDFEIDKFNEPIDKHEEDLRKKLDNAQLRIFDKYVIPYIKYSKKRWSRKDQELKFARWIIKRVFELGWTKDRFGQFDYKISRHESIPGPTNKIERMGKKYQWLAHYELLARASDNFEFIDKSGETAFKIYSSPTQMGLRNIDPTLLLLKTFAKYEYNESIFTWWFPFKYDNWDIQKNDTEWIKDELNLPDFKTIIQVVNPEDDSEWLVLGGFINLQQKISAEQDISKTIRRDIFFRMGSCLAKKSDLQKLTTWGKKQGYSGSRFPEYDSTYDIFLGELYWRKSVQQTTHDNELFWNDDFGELPAKVYVPTYHYGRESNGYDNSIDEKISIFLPNRLLVEKMGLVNKVNGTFVDSNDKIIAYDPSMFEEGPSVLLVKKDNFVRFLQECDYEIIWHVIGQKSILGHEYENQKGRLNMSGIYNLKNNKVIGNINSEYVD